MSQEEVLKYIDLLDIDEAVIDERLKVIMSRENHNEKSLSNTVLLLRYKLLINAQEDDDCDNNEELEFVAKLLQRADEGSVSLVCKIMNLVLNLNKSTLVSKSEHFLQQILSALFSDYEEDTSKELISLKICDSILDVVITNGMKAALLFLELPLDKILLSKDNSLKKHFLTYTVPKIINGTEGYCVLDKILEPVLKGSKGDNVYEGLQILCSLFDYFLPMAQEGIPKQEPTVYEGEFWAMVMDGMNTTDVNQRKMALYLTKRGVEFNVTNNAAPFSEYNETYKNNWDNFFVLMESLEEKQSNIVLPSLQFFETLEKSMSVWLKIAYNLGLSHENSQVKKKCIEMRLNLNIESTDEAKIILAALNDINLFADLKEVDVIVSKFKITLENNKHFLHVLVAIPSIQWSPVPLYYITSAFQPAPLKENIIKENKDAIIQAITDTIKLQCNNIAIKQHTQIQMLKLVGQIAKHFHWKIVLKVISMVQVSLIEQDHFNKYIPELNNLEVNEDEKTEFHNFMTSSPLYIKGCLNYFKLSNQINTFLDIVKIKTNKINDINSRQYSNKMECFDDYIYLAHLYNHTICADEDTDENTINNQIKENAKMLIQYFLSLQSDDSVINIDDPKQLEVAAKFVMFLFTDSCASGSHEIIQQLYTTANIVITDKNSDLTRKVLSLRTLEFLTEYFNCNILDKEKYFRTILNLRLSAKDLSNKENSSKLKDDFYEITAKLAFLLLEKIKEKDNLNHVINFVNHNLECGNGRCLSWVLRVVGETLPQLKSSKYDIKNFIERIWKEMEEMKGTESYEICMGEFTNMILHDAVIEDAEYNNSILFYFNKIMDLARSHASFDPLFSFVCSLSEKKISMNNGQLVHFLEEILFFSPVIKKELRIMETITNEINQTYFSGSSGSSYSTQSVQGMILTVLLKIEDKQVHHEILNFIMKKIDETFKNRDRYHADSQPHKTILIGIQHMLFYALIETKMMVKSNVDWCVKMLGKMPHQPSVRTCLEWYIALYICVKNLPLNEETVNELKLSTVPQISQQFILYYSMNHRIHCEMYKTEEYEFIMNFLLNQSMGPNFSTRIHSQYLSLNCYKNARPDPDIHKYTMDIVEKTLIESVKEKAYIKLNNDLFANKFDVICYLTPYFIYKFLPKYFDIATLGQNVNVLPKIDECKEYIEKYNQGDIIKPWMLYCMSNDEIDEIKIEDLEITSGDAKDKEVGDAIQKKYIPWKNMNDIGFGDNLVKKETTSDLIVVASLIDKLPNLGGLARTSEVFGVKTCIVPSLAKLKDPQFQGLSVSAERWVDIQEVRPGQPLKTYLMMKKDEGYSVVAAEQTSGSVPLQAFKFPKKTVLVLGHEKNGIPCDLLPLMDTCVEVPQSGFVRSLNVHVTAAIFVWEYSRQNML